MTTTRTHYRHALEQYVGKEAGSPWPSYAWPGGYPLAYSCADGESLCGDCMNTQPVTFGSGVNAFDPQWEICGVLAFGATVDYPETSEYCAHCYRLICEAEAVES